MPSFPGLAAVIENIDTRLVEVLRGSVTINDRPGPEQERPTKYILGVIGTLHLAIAKDDLSEVGQLPALVSLPNLPAWIQGIVNIRGEIISVIDLPGFLRLGGRDKCVGHRLVVLSYNNRKIGIRLDRIVGAVSHLRTGINPIDYLDTNPCDTPLFTSGLLIEKQVYTLLDVQRLLTAPCLIDYNRAGWPREQ
jgi:purine-binding chemotaxis protein CheW